MATSSASFQRRAGEELFVECGGSAWVVSENGLG